MSDEGEKTCPLCAEEMDLTDQQLRPCRCGYDICVWCWHHIMDMAEKDDTEGRCPACRTPYNKEKIVGTASKCERLVAEMSVEKKQKSQKGKTKASEGRKQLSSVRVIQRNLVYIVGLPLNLADEDLLQRKEYFGQYGKVLKVSISRTAAGAIQHFANNTCSVYITYSKEDEAVRSIQSVHGFVLEGRPLRACFGTTKYCHAWLRSMPCTNPDCLYLHEFGSQEDSFTKDEIISEYTRGRVQQLTGATNEMQRRSGNTLPPAADDYSNHNTSFWAKPISKSTMNDSANSMKGSPPNSSSGRSLALPAAASWGTRASNSQPVVENVVTSNGPSKQKVSPSSHGNEILKKHGEESPTADGNGMLEHQDSVKQVVGTDHKKMVSEIPLSVSPNDKNELISILPNLQFSDEERIDQLSSDISSINVGMNHQLQPCDDEKFLEPSAASKEGTNPNPNPNPKPPIDENYGAANEVEADLLSFNNQRLSDPEVVTHAHTGYVHNMPQSSHLSNSTDYSHSHSPRKHYVSVNGSSDSPFRNTYNMPVVNGHSSSIDGDNYVKAVSNGDHKTTFDLGENSIISNILSMDFDPWDETITSPQSLAKLLGDGDKPQGSQKVSSSRKTQNSNQSRFSFAREDDGCVDEGSNFTPNLSDFGNGLNVQNFNRDFVGNADVYRGQLIDTNGFSSFNFEESDRTAGSYSSMSSNKIPVSRSQISAPPGFFGPSRAPPPGFTSNERMEQTYDNISGNTMFDTSLLLRKMHQAPAPVYNNGGVNELEFMDPAILAVGGRVPGGITGSGLDMRSSNFPTQLTSFENDNRLRLLMQRSFTQQNQRFSELGGDGLSFSQRATDPYGVPSRIVEPNNRSTYQQQGNFQQPRMSNGHWGDGWSEIQSGNDIAMAELLRNERLGFNKYYSGYEDTKFRMPSSGDVYNNRTYGI